MGDIGKIIRIIEIPRPVEPVVNPEPEPVEEPAPDRVEEPAPERIEEPAVAP